MYALSSDLEKRLSSDELLTLADDDGDGTADTDVVNAALADADAEIDLSLVSRYTLPLVSTPAIMTKIACDLAIHHLFAHRRTALSLEHASRYREAIELLSRLNSGELLLSTASVAPLSGLPESTTREQTKTFSSDSLEPF